jgi:hypothetical protein
MALVEAPPDQEVLILRGEIMGPGDVPLWNPQGQMASRAIALLSSDLRRRLQEWTQAAWENDDDDVPQWNEQGRLLCRETEAELGRAITYEPG